MALALLCAGCATIVEGTTQPIRVEANAPNFRCQVSRNGEMLGESTSQQPMVTVSKSKDDLMISCAAPGYQERAETLSSNLSSATVASFFLLDFGIVDAATGAWKKYPDRITLLLQPSMPPPAPPVAHKRARQKPAS
ncbi:MAG: hypothetical protein J0H17_01435 [Rhizobiales bacterium]|nr:hypothetical protein [Hyphomicrobiales bacterium]